MTRRVLDVGNCRPDHHAIRRMIESHFDAEVVQAHLPEDAIETLRSTTIDLVLVNRELDEDGSEGLEVIRSIKANPDTGQLPCMLVTNFADHQQKAMQDGAEMGFGKAALDTPETIARLRPFLSE